MNELSKIIGFNIKVLRNKKGISQERLAELSKVHRTYIGKIERGEKNISIQSIYAITTALDISLNEFFSLVEPSFPSSDNSSINDNLIVERNNVEYSPIHEFIDIIQNANPNDQKRIIEAVKFMVNWLDER